MFYARLFVPVADDAGARFAKADWLELEGRLLTRLGGFHIEGERRGAWRSDSGREDHEVSRVYAIALDSVRQISDFIAIADWARQHFREEAIFVEIDGRPEILGPPNPASGL